MSPHPVRPAIFASAFHPHIGGVEELVRQLAHEQERLGHTPVVVTNRYPKTLPGDELVEGTRVLRYPFRVPEPTARQMGGWALFAAATRRQIRRDLAAGAVDLIHVQCVSSNGRYALAAAGDLNLPLVVSLQGELTMDASSVYQRSAQLRGTLRRLLDRAAVVTACSGFVLREAEEFYGQTLGDRGRVVSNGIRLEDFGGDMPAPPERPFVLGIGRMVRQKGFDVLIRAYAALGDDALDLVLAGDGPERAALEALVTELGLGARVRFPGRVAHDAAVALFRTAAVFVLPSRHEPQGIVVLEAMAAGAPVVAAAVGGVPEVVEDGVNGLLYRAEDATHLSEKLRELLSRSDLKESLTGAASVTAEGYSWARLAREYEDCYAQARQS